MSDASRPGYDAYIRDLFIPSDDALETVLSASAEAGLPTIQVPPELGRLLSILLQAVGARRVLELGTLGGYSTLWMARALPADGRILSLEAEPLHAEVARANLARAGVADRAEVRLGMASELLPTLSGEQFDAVFIDADKPSYLTYLEWSLRLLRPGGLLVADNVLSRVVLPDPATASEASSQMHEFNQTAARDPRLEAIILPNRQGGDGFLIGVRRP